MKVVFLGTPSFALSVLERIYLSEHKVVAVITQPDKTNARGNKVVFSPVKSFALENNIPVFQFNSISKEGIDIIDALDADILVTAAFGQILSEKILTLKKHGVINCHASLLPKYRGASPVQWALIDGEKETGVTVMKTALEVDSGDMILKKNLPLSGDENAEECLDLLSKLGGEAIVDALNQIERGVAVYEKQDHEKATFCKKISKEDGHINFSLPAERIKNFVRGMTPSPSAFAFYNGVRVKIIKCELTGEKFPNALPGEIVRSGKNALSVACGDKEAINILVLQKEGGKKLDFRTFLLGNKMDVGAVLE